MGAEELSCGMMFWGDSSKSSFKFKKFPTSFCCGVLKFGISLISRHCVTIPVTIPHFLVAQDRSFRIGQTRVVEVLALEINMGVNPKIGLSQNGW